MPKKSRHSKKKRSFQSKAKRIRQGFPATSVVPPPAAAQASKPAITPKSTFPPAGASTLATQTTAQYPYILDELKRIGILTGIILVILIVLALVLP